MEEPIPSETIEGSSPPPVQAPTDAQDEDGAFLRFRRSHFYAALLPLAFVTGLAAGYLAWGRDGTADSNTQAQQAPVVAATQTTRMEVSIDDDPVLGPADAPVTIVEFSDFNCPYCQRFHQQTFQTLLDSYGDQIRFVYRDFPVTSQESFRAAQAAECADDQGSFWAYHDALFSGEHGLGLAAYRQYAEDLGLDGDELMACIEEERYSQEVQDDARYASGLGVSGTPTFFINGIPLVGAQPLEQFTQIIDDELN